MAASLYGLQRTKSHCWKKISSGISVSDTLVSVAHSTVLFILNIRTLTSVQEVTALSAGQDLYRHNALCIFSFEQILFEDVV